VGISPAEELTPLSDHELRVLRQVGQHWASVVGSGGERLRELPVDPRLRRSRRPPAPTRFGRIAQVQMFKTAAPDELVATELAAEPESRTGQLLARARHLLLGPPLHSAAVVQERMTKVVALPVLSSDVLSSVAYGPEAMLVVLALAGSAALRLSLPIGAALALLMVTVGLSYRQTIAAYPSGAGSYIVASRNLGPRPGLAAAAGLLVDYVLTVSVSVAAGVDAITSAMPGVKPQTVPLGLLVIAVLLAANLRGVRHAGNLFAAPTYAFVLAILLLIVTGLAQAARRGFSAAPPPPLEATEPLTMLLVLRAFAAGAASMTGIEAVSNAVPAFQPVEWRNARTTLTWIVTLLVVTFSGLVALIHLGGIVPRPGETMLSQLGRRVFHGGPLYAYLQATTVLILLLAANTAFNGFPRLLFFMARDAYAPRIFLRIGDRLAFSNGIIALAVAAAVIFAAFQGRTRALIPLYAVGVFLAFTLSQTGMVVHWWRNRGAHWRRSMAVNGCGALLSAVVLLTAAITRFTAGAWVVLAGIPLLIALALRIHRHYDTVRQAVSLHPLPDRARAISPAVAPRRARGRAPAAGEERQESPEQIQHLIVVPVARLDLAALRALAYAASLSQPTLGVHISSDEDEAERFRRQWHTWGDHLPLEIIVSPYRAIIAPLSHYLEALHAQRRSVTLTVVLPEIVVRHRWHEILHGRAPQRLRRALRPHPGIVITSVPVHLTR
jgi:amino acid transporter